ncbi:MAG: DUF1501 domain-containing protein [Bacteroidota bacterium]
MFSRRDFLKVSSLASAASLMPGFLQELSFHPIHAEEKKLVIIQFSGGNDGLNTVIPYGDDNYYRLRKDLGIPESEILPLNDYQGLHPEMQALRSLYDQGEMSILNAVGYPNPDRSHFRSMDIWHTGSSAEEYWDTGWLGRYLDHACAGCSKPHSVLEMDTNLSLAVKGIDHKALAVQNPTQLHQSVRDPWFATLEEQQGVPPESDLAYLYKTMVETRTSAQYLHETHKIYRSKQIWPVNPLARQLKTVSELIISGAETKVYYVSLTGFDTHVRQKAQQARLLKQYSEAIEVFVKELKQHDQFDKTLLMTFSEFGRRVKENASGGTDHGKANNLFLLGGALKQPGFVNPAPSLTKLDDGDVQWQIDFRQVYASVLRDWLGADDEAILKRKFERLRLV